MSETTITTVSDFGAESFEGCHLRVVHSEPINRWQAFKYRFARSWWFRRFVRRYPIKYLNWTEDIGKVTAVSGTTITVDGLHPFTDSEG